MHSVSESSGPDGARRTWQDTWRGGLALLLLTLAVYGPGQWIIPVVDRDEARFAQASRQMLEAVALPVSRRDDRPLEHDDHSRIIGGLHAGSVVIPMLIHRPRLNKPPLIYWLQGASAAMFTAGDPTRDHIGMYRLPSFLAAILSIWLVWRMGTSLICARAGWLAAACLAVCPVLAWEARQARADVVLLAVTLVAMFALWKVYARWCVARLPVFDTQSNSFAPVAEQTGGNQTQDQPLAPPHRHTNATNTGWLWQIVLWLAMGLGVLVKGPITPMIVALTIAALCLWHRRVGLIAAVRPLVGLVVLALVITPWVLAVGARVGWDQYLSIVLDETLGRSVSAKEGHWGPPGYHLLLLGVLLWPVSLVVVQGLVRAWRLGLIPPRAASDARLLEAPSASDKPPGLAYRLRGAWRHLRSRRVADPASAFLLAWAIPSWIVFELVGTKLPHYTLPLYPALAIAASAYLTARRTSQSTTRNIHLVRAWFIVGIAVCALPIAALCTMMMVDGSIDRSEIVLVVLAGAMLAVMIALLTRAAILLRRSDAFRAVCLGIACAAAAWAIGPGVFLPRARMLWVSDALAGAIRAADPETARPIAAISYHEDSLIFHTRARLVRLNEDQHGQWRRDHPDGLLILPDSKVLRSHYVLARVKGVNYSRGSFVSLALVTWWRPVDQDPESRQTPVEHEP